MTRFPIYKPRLWQPVSPQLYARRWSTLETRSAERAYGLRFGVRKLA